MKKKFIVIFLLMFIFSFFVFFTLSNQSSKLNSSKFIQSTTPTLFFHGYGSSANAERHMTESARKAGVTKTIIQANVDRKGQVTIRGRIPKGAINPIVMVQYEDNRNPDYLQDAAYAKAVVEKLKQAYGFQEMKMVGHSMGNMSILYYLLEYGSEENLPKLIKQVNLANHVAGLENWNLPSNLTLDPKTGQPSAMNEQYQKLTGLREVYPDKQIDVLNIYGDIGGNTDGSVLNISSQALKYLLINHAKSYKEVKISGHGGQHSRLHENSEVDQLLIDFLWRK
ncbi:alpha/beta hydrolase [Streptococcus gordonii]|uniref:alpha/beta hydrolase n=1 Tax=Streptococcus gordonii TaxID=1302 RepID=UPI000617E86A|nr:alpha/beta hydrolase [Streptococcus gordonii]ALD72399.1 alpha/beta hydrolase [Streptococcus gordonii]AOS71557.1 alpha/beta hydrolase [Streptococcus gordonii]